MIEQGVISGSAARRLGTGQLVGGCSGCLGRPALLSPHGSGEEVLSFPDSSDPSSSALQLQTSPTEIPFFGLCVSACRVLPPLFRLWSSSSRTFSLPVNIAIISIICSCAAQLYLSVPPGRISQTCIYTNRVPIHLTSACLSVCLSVCLATFHS